MSDIKREGKSFRDMKKSEPKGKIIGQIESGSGMTQSGQPRAYKNVYDRFDHPDHAGFNSYEHRKAAESHNKIVSSKRAELRIPGKSHTKIGAIEADIKYHETQRDLHVKAADKS